MIICHIKLNILYIPTGTYDGKQHAKMGQYCIIHGASAAALYFSRKLQHRVSESTVKSIIKAYQEEQRKQKRRGQDDDTESLPEKKRGRGFYLVMIWITYFNCI